MVRLLMVLGFGGVEQGTGRREQGLGNSLPAIPTAGKPVGRG